MNLENAKITAFADVGSYLIHTKSHGSKKLHAKFYPLSPTNICPSPITQLGVEFLPDSYYSVSSLSRGFPSKREEAIKYFLTKVQRSQILVKPPSVDQIILMKGSVTIVTETTGEIYSEL